MTEPKKPTLEERIAYLEIENRTHWANHSRVSSQVHKLEDSVKSLKGIGAIACFYGAFIFFIMQQNKITKLKSELEEE